MTDDILHAIRIGRIFNPPKPEPEPAPTPHTHKGDLSFPIIYPKPRESDLSFPVVYPKVAEGVPAGPENIISVNRY